MTERALLRWIFDTCLLFGATAKTAGAVVGHFEDALRSGEIAVPEDT